MGLFDDNGLFGGLFDFNGDGKTTWDEEFLAFKIFDECTKEQESNFNDDLSNDFDSDVFDDTDSSDKYEWRLYCEDGFEFGVDPEDYETEEEYKEALEEEKTAWRDTCEDGFEFGVDPEDYETEEEYEEALDEAKYGWRENCESVLDTAVDPEDYETEEEYKDALEEEKTAWRDTCEDGFEFGIDPEDYETEEEYEKAIADARERINNIGITLNVSMERPTPDKTKEDRQKELDKRLKEVQLAEQEKMKEYENDKTIYTYCGVLLPFSSRPYSFRTEDKTLQIGDTVIVPVGKDREEMKGKIVSIGQYLRLGVPYPVEKTKMIIRKTEEEIK